MEKEGKNTAVKLYRVIKKKAPPKDLKIGEQPVTPPVIAPAGK
jgi:hypothetical protein